MEWKAIVVVFIVKEKEGDSSRISLSSLLKKKLKIFQHSFPFQ